MRFRAGCLVMAIGVLSAGVALAQDDDLPLNNWTPPPYWTPPRAAQAAPDGQMRASAAGMTAHTQVLSSAPLPFTAIPPCRVADTRGNGFTGAYGPPALVSGSDRTFTIAGQCGIPSGAAAVSFNFTIAGMTTSGDIRVYPAGGSLPVVSTQNWTASTGAIANAAVAPLGGGGVTVHLDGAGSAELIIDVNGYYGPSSVVTSLNTLTGDVTLAAGSNVTITPSANTLTIAATGGGGSLPTGTTGQTLYNNGSAWTASSALTNDGTNVGITGNLNLPNTTASTGQIELGGNRFVHNFGFDNTFVGVTAGNLTMTGSTNTAIGYASLRGNTTGSGNTASGVDSLLSNTTGSNNTASGTVSLWGNTTGSDNTASGVNSLTSNASASQNTAVGSGALASQSYDPGHSWASDNTAVGFNALNANQPDYVVDGIQNSALGSGALKANTTGSYNTAAGYQSLGGNTSGGYNTAVGSSAGATNTGGYWNTFVGSGADATATGLLDATAIGYFAKVDNSYKVRIGDVSVQTIEGEVAWSYPSDERLKDNIRNLDLGLDFVMKLRPVSFTMKQGNGRTDMGFIAQDIEALLGDDYNLLGIGQDAQRTLSLRGTDFIAPIVKAIQEQQAQIADQARTIQAQQAQIESRDARIAKLEGLHAAQQADMAALAARLAAIEARLAAK